MFTANFVVNMSISEFRSINVICTHTYIYVQTELLLLTCARIFPVGIVTSLPASSVPCQLSAADGEHGTARQSAAVQVYLGTGRKEG